MHTKLQEKQEIFDYWNAKGIVVHRRLNHEIDTEITRALKYYPKSEICEAIDFYATILEPGVPMEKKQYFWSYKWNLYEFLKRGIKKFEGQELDNYLAKKKSNHPAAITFKRK